MPAPAPSSAGVATVVLTEWLGDLSVPTGAVLLAALYAYGLWRLRPAGTEPPSGWQIASFGLGVLTLLLALYSPLHDLSDRYLFSAHMVQHLLLVMGMPIFLLLGLPAWMVDSLLGARPVRAVWKVLALPPVAYALFNGAFAGSHVPAFYDLVLREHWLHTAEHLVFMATAVLAWWPVLSPSRLLPAIPAPARVLYLFLHTFPMMMVGAIVTDAKEPIYAPYAQAPRVWGIAPLPDQQAGGLLMWIGGSLIYLVVLTVVFFRWAAREDTKEPDAGRPTSNARRAAPGAPWAMR